MTRQIITGLLSTYSLMIGAGSNKVENDSFQLYSQPLIEDNPHGVWISVADSLVARLIPIPYTVS